MPLIVHEVPMMVPDMSYAKDKYRPSTRYLIEGSDGKVGLPMSRKELYAEAARRGDKLDFVQQIVPTLNT